MKQKAHKTLNKNEFNALIDELEKYKVDYIFKKLACCVSVETANCIYECSLLKNSRHIINCGVIGNCFSKTKYDVITGKYGYKEIPYGPDKTKVVWDYQVAYGYAYTDPYYANKQLKCWSYDVNSAFAYAMLSPMPNTSQEPRFDSEVQEGEIGFYKLGGATTEVGEPADIIFPLMDSPFKEYVMKYYERKENSTGLERRKWKEFLNIPTGLIARKNIFIRNAILYYSNKYIKSFIDDDTVYCNIDCIVSLRPRYDLPIGEGLGQFKEEHKCEDFKYHKAMQYQWGHECHYSGIPSEALNDIDETEGWTNRLAYIVKGHKVYENEIKK